MTMKATTIKEQRMIIQIAFEPAMFENDPPTLHALCNDGTLWYRVYNDAKGKTIWRLKDGIPGLNHESKDNN